MRLAEHVAHTTDVDGMLASMTSQQFDEWCAKDLIEPIGHAGTHDILAMIGAMLAAYIGSKDVELSDFKWWKKEETEKPVEQDSVIMAFEAFGMRRQ